MAKSQISMKTSPKKNIRKTLKLIADEPKKFLVYLDKSKENWHKYRNGKMSFNDVDEPYCRLISLICFETGARIGEVKHLNYNQFDFEKRRILRDVKVAKDLTDKTETDKDDYIFISDIVINEVQSYWNENYSGRSICNNKGNGQLFWNKKHNKIIGDLRKTWDNFLKRAGVSKVGFHALRRNLGKDLYALTKDTLKVRDQLGHADVATTITYYIETEKEINSEINDLSIERRKMIKEGI
jgi:integrase